MRVCVCVVCACRCCFQGKTIETTFLLCLRLSHHARCRCGGGGPRPTLNRSSSCTHHRPRTCVTGFGMAWRAQTSPCFPGRHQKTGRSSSTRSPDEAVCAAKRPCCLFLHLPLSKRDVGGVHIPHPLVLVQVEPMEIRLTYASTVGAEEGGKGSSDAGSELQEPFRVYRRD